jgi:hypothetical protein
MGWEAALAAGAGTLFVLEMLLSGAAPHALARLAFVPAGRHRHALTERLSRLLAPEAPPREPKRIDNGTIVFYSAAAGRPALFRIARGGPLFRGLPRGVVRLDARVVDGELDVRARYFPAPLFTLLAVSTALALFPAPAVPGELTVLAVIPLLILGVATLRARSLARRALEALAA